MNNASEKLNIIINEIQSIFSVVDNESSEELIEYILSADRVFITGQGRSGIMSRAFAMRLMHLGLKCFVVGETVTPSIKKEDLLIACSGSGETGITCYITKTVYEIGACICAITTNKNSKLAGISNLCITIPSEGSIETLQFGGSLFEQSLLIYLDGIIALIIDKLGKSYDEMKSMHTNLE